MFLFVKEQCTLTDMSIHHVNVTSAGPARSMVREEQKYTYLNKQWICLGKAESKFVCFNGTLFSITMTKHWLWYWRNECVFPAISILSLAFICLKKSHLCFVYMY